MTKISTILFCTLIARYIAFQNPSFLIFKKIHNFNTYLSTENIEDSSKSNAAEQLRFNAILKQQGLTIDDIKKLKDAISSGSRYNKKENSSPAMTEQIKLKSNKKDTLAYNPPTIDSKNSESVSELSKPSSESHLSNVLPSDPITTIQKNTVIRPKIKITKTKPTIIKNTEINLKTKSIQMTTKLSSNDLTEEFYTDNSIPTPNSRSLRKVSDSASVITLDGVTLKNMIESLVDEYGWPYLYDETKLRCFKSDPTIMSSLKVLRQDGSTWARKKIEYLYLQMRKQSRNIS